MYAFGPALRRAIQLLFRALRGLFIVVGMILVVALSVAWAGTLIGAFALMPLVSFLAPLVSWLPVLTFVSLLVFIGVPLFFLVMWLMRIMFDTRIHGGLAAALTLAWIFSITGLISSGWLMAREFQDEERVLLKEAAVTPAADTIDIGLQPWPRASDGLLRIHVDDALSYRDGDLYLAPVAVSIMPAADDTLRVVVEAEASGSDDATARTNALHIDYPLQLRPDEVRLSPWFRLEKGKQWRAQQVRAIVYVPSGKYVRVLPSDARTNIGFFPPDGPARTIWPQRTPQLIRMPATGKEPLPEAEPAEGEL